MTPSLLPYVTFHVDMTSSLVAMTPLCCYDTLHVMTWSLHFVLLCIASTHLPSPPFRWEKRQPTSNWQCKGGHQWRPPGSCSGTRCALFRQPAGAVTVCVCVCVCVCTRMVLMCSVQYVLKWFIKSLGSACWSLWTKSNPLNASWKLCPYIQMLYLYLCC